MAFSLFDLLPAAFRALLMDGLVVFFRQFIKLLASVGAVEREWG